MSDKLESFLQLMCKSAVKSQQNEQQTLYTLSSVKDGKLAYDILAASGLDVKFYPDTEIDSGKLYVHNASLAKHDDAKLDAATVNGPLLRQLKEVLDGQSNPYTLAYVKTPTGYQLTVALPQNSGPATAPRPATQNAPQATIAAKNPVRKAPAKPEDDILSGPAVARAAIPKSFKTSATDEDPLIKRAMLYMSGRAFTSTAWMLFLALILGVVFSILVMLKGFLCPDVATDARTIPAYCPQKNVKPQQQ